MNDEMRGEVERVRAEILAHPDHEFSFGSRRSFLLAFGPLVKDEDGRHTILAPGLVRRARLAILCAERVLPEWHRHYEARDPDLLLQLADGYLRGQVSRDALRSRAYSFSGGLSTSDIPARKTAYLAGRAAVSAAYVAASDELLEPDEMCDLAELMNPEDPDHFDCAFWASSADAGGTPREKSHDRRKALEFWTRYLDKDVPAAWDAAPDGT